MSEGLAEAINDKIDEKFVDLPKNNFQKGEEIFAFVGLLTNKEYDCISIHLQRQKEQ